MDLNWERSPTKWRHRLFSAVMIGILIILAVICKGETGKEWMGFQKEYNEKLAVRLNKPEFAATPVRIKQIWVKELNAIDRCTTCHSGVENPLFGKEPQPFTADPGGFLRNHPVDTFAGT